MLQFFDKFICCFIKPSSPMSLATFTDSKCLNVLTGVQVTLACQFDPFSLESRLCRSCIEIVSSPRIGLPFEGNTPKVANVNI